MFRLIAPAVYRCASASHVGSVTSLSPSSPSSRPVVSSVREPARGVYTSRLEYAGGGRLSRSCAPSRAGAASLPADAALRASRRCYTTGRGGGSSTSHGTGGKDYYKILGIEKNADVKEIKKAYRKRALETHPDQGGNKEEFAEVAEAYEILSNPEKRQVYDQYGSDAALNANMGGDAAGGFGGRSAEDIFAEFFKGGFGDMFGGGGSGGAGRGRGTPVVQPIEVRLRLTLEEVYAGVHKSLRVTRPQVCTECEGHGTKSKQPKQKCTHCHGNGHVVQHHRLGPGMVQQTVTECGRCHGSGNAARPEDQCGRCHGNGYRSVSQEVSVDIPAGVPSNVTLVMRGEGGVIPGAQPGDLHVHIEIAPHRLFQRRGNDLIVEKEVTLEEALLGLQLPLKLLDGRTVSVHTTHESVLKPDGVIKVRGEGMMSSTGTRGDVYVLTRLKMPNKLSEAQREHIQKALGEPKKDAHAVPGNIVKGRVMHETRNQLEEQKRSLWAAQEGMGGGGRRGASSSDREDGQHHRHGASGGMPRGECATQ